jgi:acyl-CoA thioester hydrolase
LAEFSHRIAVRYGEVDRQGVVFNAHYLAYCDDAVETWFRTAQVPTHENGYDFMLKKAVVEWQGSATNGEELEITCSAIRWGNTSFDVGFVGTVGDRPVFTATITYVGVRLGTTETMPPPPAVREAIGG